MSQDVPKYDPRLSSHFTDVLTSSHVTEPTDERSEFDTPPNQAIILEFDREIATPDENFSLSQALVK
jgi:hypothetical protein